MPKGQQTITPKRPQTEDARERERNNNNEESKTIKGCAWLATDDSQTGGQKEQPKSGGRVGERWLKRQVESLFAGRELHLTEMNCSARSCNPQQHLLCSGSRLRPVNDYVMNLHCYSPLCLLLALSQPFLLRSSRTLLQTICPALTCANRRREREPAACQVI